MTGQKRSKSFLVRPVTGNGREFLGDGAKLVAVVNLAGNNPAEQRDVEIGDDRQAEADWAKIGVRLRVMSPLGKFGRCTGFDSGSGSWRHPKPDRFLARKQLQSDQLSPELRTGKQLKV